MRLLIETGLTHFKYARMKGNRPIAIESLVGGSSAAEPPWASALARLAPTPKAVYVANGGPATFRPRLTEWIRRAWHIEPCFISAPPDRNTPQPVTRHLALVAVRRRALAPGLVVTADVTIAVDGLDAQGNRVSAWTFPGERPMRESLYAQTSGIAAAALLDPAVVDNGFGVNTAGAVQEGARVAIASCIAELARRTQRPVVATGRFAHDAVQWMEPPALIHEHLAMEGLAYVVAEGAE
jgi:Type III pantothenate kinase